MNRQKFLKILSDFHNIPVEDIPKLQQLEQEYPFSQVIHCLIAKAAHDGRLQDAKQKINRAALYATDRKVLKDIIESTGFPQDEQVSYHNFQDTNTETVFPKTPESVTSTIPEPVHVPAQVLEQEDNDVEKLEENEAELLREEVMRNLAMLMESKKPYTRKESKKNKGKHAEKEKKIKPESSKKKDLEESVVPVKNKQYDDEVIDTLTSPIQELKPERKKVSLFNRQREQIDIIDRFINSEPTIKKKNKPDLTSEKDQKDLAENSGSFGEELVSETLAKILAKQGKKAKAVDIYKKLIWKFPQKKAYFASLIEDLKN